MATLFKDETHREFYEAQVTRTHTENDTYHQALFYTLGLTGETRRNIETIYNFKERCINLESLRKGWQTSESTRVCRLAFNLFNGYTGSGKSAPLFTPYELFDSGSINYMLEAIKIRYPTYVHTQKEMQLHLDLSNEPASDFSQELRSPKQFVNLRQRLFVDMDGTLAVFRPVDQLETLYRKGYFSGLAPIENVVEAVKLIVREHPEIEVHVLSACLSDSAYALQEKNEWLDRYLPEVAAAHRIFPPCGQDKTEFVPHGLRETDFLLDDYTKNLRQWEPPARGIKLLNGINHTRGTWQADRIRYDRSPRELSSGIIGAMQGVAHVQDEHHGLSPAQEPSYERFGTPPPMAQAKPAAAPLQAVSPAPAPAEPPMAFPDPMGFEP